MKFVLLVAVLVLAKCSYGAPQGAATEPVPIISQQTNIEPDGAYEFSFETGDGVKRQEQGTVKKATSADSSDVIVVQGQVSYTAPDGQQITLIYAADDTNGFQPQGDHLPTPPPIPPEIQKALDYLASLPPSQPN